jgi:hypothetical protein
VSQPREAGNAASERHYLLGRIAQVFDARVVGRYRPTWTLTDARAVRAVLDALDSPPMQAALTGEDVQARERTGA